MIFDFKRNHILQALLLVGLAWLIFVLKDVVLVVFIAFLFTVILRPLVNWLRHHHVPAALAVLLPVLGLIGLFVLLGFFLVPTVAHQTSQFVNQLPDYFDKLRSVRWLHASNLNVNSIKNALQSHFSSLSSTIFKVTSTALKVLAGLISAIVLTLYWTGSYDSTKRTMLSFVPENQRGRIEDIWGRIEKKLVSWVVAQLFLSTAVGVLVWIGAVLLHLSFAGILGLISGLLEVVPTLGPIISAVPGILLGFTISVDTGIFTIVMYIIVHQLENHLLAPLLLGRAVRLHPMVVIIGLLIGAIFAGIIGVLLSVPAALCISAVVDSYRGERSIRSIVPFKKN